jgi:hypothetical protein
MYRPETADGIAAGDVLAVLCSTAEYCLYHVVGSGDTNGKRALECPFLDSILSNWYLPSFLISNTQLMIAQSIC